LNAADDKGMLPIHYAVMRNNEAMVRKLIELKEYELIFGQYITKLKKEEMNSELHRKPNKKGLWDKAVIKTKD